MENSHPALWFELSGKTAVITGGGGVLGGAIALGLAELGVNVAILDRTRQSGDQVVEKITSAGGKALAVECGVLNKSNLVEAQKIVRNHFGKTDFLINSVGGNKAEATTSLIISLSIGTGTNTSLWGSWRTVRTCAVQAGCRTGLKCPISR
ncbi:MAG: SDR family NAD(P)-dependent oxidoreductase [Brevefilum sp.]